MLDTKIVAKTKRNAAYSAYSESCEAWLRERIRRIETLDGDTEFRTRELRVAAGPYGGETIRLEARFDPATRLWNVDEIYSEPRFYSKEIGGEMEFAPALRKKAALEDVCLFDALYACAKFELSSIMQGYLPMTDAPDPRALYFKTFGEAQGQPFTCEGVPLPAAHGRIQVDGDFPPEAWEIAKKTTAQMPPSFLPAPVGIAGPQGWNLPVLAAPAVQDDKNLPVPAGVDPEIWLKAFPEICTAVGGALKILKEKNLREGGALQVVGHSICRMGNALGDVLPWTPLAVLSTLLGCFVVEAIATHAAAQVFAAWTLSAMGGGVGISALAGGVLGLFSKGAYPQKRLDEQLAKFRTQAAALPGGPDRDNLLKLADEMELGFHALRLRQAYREAATGKLTKAKAGRATKYRESFNDVARRVGMPALEIEALDRQLRQDPTGSDDAVAKAIRDSLEKKFKPLWALKEKIDDHVEVQKRLGAEKAVQARLEDLRPR